MLVRPIIEPIFVTPINIWATLGAHFAIFGIFLLAVWLICKKNEKANETALLFSLCMSLAVGLILQLVFGLSIGTVKGMLLVLIMLHASLSDIKSRTVPDYISLMLIILAFVDYNVADLPTMLCGAAVVFIPQFALAMIRPSRACGGADIKISTALAFLLGAEKGIIALIAGLLIAVIFMTIYDRVKGKDRKEAFPLVPFLAIGAIFAYII